MKRVGLFIASILTVLHMLSASVNAQTTPPERGLLVTPPRQYLTVQPDTPTESSFVVANLTDHDVDVMLSVEQFSVANYTYDYKFEPPKEDWIKLEETKVSLKKTESKTIRYTVRAPQGARPGGHYFTIFSSVNIAESKQIRAATVLYVTASGELDKTSKITQNTLPWITIGGDIPLQFDVQNTGNTHFLVYISGVLRGWGPTESSSETAHVLLPDSTRRVEGKLPAPLIPGLYQAVYGYRDEDGKDVRKSQYILYAPPWTWILLAGVIWLGITLVRRKRRLKRAY